MQCKHFPLANHSAFSKQLKQYSEPHNKASFHTDSRDSSGEGWCYNRQRTIEIAPIDIYSFLHGLLFQESSHSPRDLGSAHTPSANEFFIRHTGNWDILFSTFAIVNQNLIDGYGICSSDLKNNLQ